MTEVRSRNHRESRKHDSRVRSVLGLAPLVILAAVTWYGPTGCGETIPDPCWAGLDTLYAAGIVVRDAGDVRAVFEAYVTGVDSTGGEFPDGAVSWEFDHAEYDHRYLGLSYWKVWHFAQYPDQPAALLRRYLDVDENGTLVVPLGCI